MAGSGSTKFRVRDGFPGQRMFVLPRGSGDRALADTDGVGLVVTDVGHFPSASRHYIERGRGTDQLILIYCTAGVGWAEVRGRRVAVTAGRVVAIGRGVPHAYGASDDRPWTIHWVHLAGRACGAIERMLLEPTQPPLVEVGNDVELTQLFEKVLDLMCGSDAPGSSARASLVAAGLVERLIDSKLQAVAGSDVRDRMTRAIQFMWRRVSAHASLEEIAEAANMSVSHFAASFKAHTGVSPVAYFHRLKMQQAAQLLDSTALSIKAVAARVGYDDPLYFSRRFRAIHHVSPARYRDGDVVRQGP